MSTATRASSTFSAKDLRTRIETRKAKIGIIGMGYVGLPLALLFSERDFPVTGFDIDNKKVDALNGGKSYIYRIPETEIAAARDKAIHPASLLRAMRQIPVIHFLWPFRPSVKIRATTP